MDDVEYNLREEHQSFYLKNGFIKLKQVFSAKEIALFEDIVEKKVLQISQGTTPLAERDTYGKAFIQLCNLWTLDDEIKKLVFCERLARIAAKLMEVKGVRLYHDQALFKEPGGGITPWHADQYYWPLSGNKTITAWIPLQTTSLEMGPIEFSAQSHLVEEGRELEIGDQSERVLNSRLRSSNFPHIIEPFDIGEVSFHSGWIFHHAGANNTTLMRRVMTIIYMEKDMVLKEPENKHQKNDWDTWCPGARIGKVIETPLNPILYEM